jgi:hypothetical protein
MRQVTISENGSHDRCAETLTCDFLPFAVVRRGGVSARSLQRLLFLRTIALLDHCSDLERDSDDLKAETVRLLERVIGRMAQSPERMDVISLKRDVFNDRLPHQDLGERVSSAIEQGLAPADRSVISAWLANRHRREILLQDAERVFVEELCVKRGQLRALCRRAEFRNGIDFASSSLSQKVGRYLACPEQFPPGQRHRMERSLIRYYTRSALKLSPFSSFTRTHVVRIENPTADSWLKSRSQWHLRRRAQLNRSIVAQLAHRVSQHPQLRGFVPVFANGAAVRSGDRILVMRHRYEGKGPVRFRVPIESLVELPYKTAFDMVLALLGQSNSYVSLEALTSALATRVGVREDASRFVKELIEVGLLNHKFPLPEDDSTGLDAFIRYLSDIPAPDARLVHLAQQLTRLAYLEQQFDRAAPGQVTHLLKEMEAIIGNAHRAIGDVPVPDWGGRLVFQDAVEQSVGSLWPSAAWFPAIGDLREFLRVYVPLLDMYSSVRESIRSILQTEFRGGPVALLRFAARYHQATAESSKRESDAQRRRRNPLGLASLSELQTIRNELGAIITLQTNAEEIDLQIAAQRARWADRFLQVKLPRPISDSLAVTCFVQPCLLTNGRYGLVANTIDGGPWRTLLRTCSALPEQQCKAQLLQDLSRTLRQLYKTAEPCTIRGTYDFNANLSPSITSRFIDYQSDPTLGAQAIPLGAIFISAAEDGSLHLTAEGRELAPVSFGCFSSVLQPLVTGLLLALERSEPILIKPFDPRNWGVPFVERNGEIGRYPRLVYGRCVARRRGWYIPGSVLPRPREGETQFAYFVRVRQWQRQIGLPDQVFIRLRAVSDEIDGRSRDERAMSVAHKPQYVDFRNDFLVESLRDSLQKPLPGVYFEEALPGLQDWTDLGISRALEIVLDATIEGPHSTRQADSMESSGVAGKARIFS